MKMGLGLAIVDKRREKANSSEVMNIIGSVEIVNDVRQVCLSNNKMTEKQRLEIVFGIRPKLKLMNQKLKRLIRAVKYTRLSDVWAEIDYGARSEVDKPTIVQRCKERWRRNARP
jgi:hypothetical protein